MPVRLGDRVIGFLATGQVFTRRRSRPRLEGRFARLFPLGSAAEKKAARLWKQTPSMAASTYEATVQLLNFFGRQLSALSNQIVTREQTLRPPVVARARQFIAQNKSDALSLGAVAKAAGASVFHFCKIFKGATGLKFTDYVARIAIGGRAKASREPKPAH